MTERRKIERRAGMSRQEKIRKESGGMLVAEFASGITTVGVVAVLDKIAPNLTQSATKYLAKHIFEPYLDKIENSLGYVCKLEECRPDKTKSREERAESLARATVLFAPAFVASLLVKLAVREGMNEWKKIPNESIPYKSSRKWYKPWERWSKKDWMIVGIDEGVHLGAIAMTNIVTPQVGDKLLRSTENILKAAGVSDRKAKDAANTLVVWELPNAVGLAAGLGAVYGHHTYGWAHKERIKGSGLFEPLPVPGR